MMMLVACAPAAAPSPTAAPKAVAPAEKPAAEAKPAEAKPAPPAAKAESKPADAKATNYFEGKTITLVAGSSPGGGTDNINRLIARHLGRFIPGKPNIIVQNVDGAGGVIALNQVAAAKPDGLTFNGSVSQTLFYAQIQGTQQQLRYDLSKLSWIGSAFEDTQALWLRGETPYTSLDAIRTASTPPKLGAQAGTHSSVVLPKVVQEVTGLKFNVVTGYPGSPEILLDVERGALDGRFSSFNSLKGERPDWLTNKFVRLLVYVARERDKNYPDVPSIVEIVPPDKRALLALVFGPQEVNRTMAGPPGIPPEIAKPVIDGYKQMSSDPEFLADMSKIGFEPGYTGPEAISESLTRLFSDKEMGDALKRILGT
jgi:tripartite-type tricarboxylate transporter receptor subunit TctC